MECVSRKITETERSGFDFLPVFLAGISLVGAVTGTFVFARSYTDADVAGFVALQRELPVDFAEYFVRGIFEELPFFGGLLVLALLAPGWLFAPAVLFTGGLRIGTAVCCLYSGCGIWGALYALAVIAAPALCVQISRVILCHGSMLLSMQLFRSAFYTGSAGSVAGKLIIRIPLCAAIELFAAATAALARTFMYRFIS